MSAIEPVAIAILAKAPIPGFAKTRLIPALGDMSLRDASKLIADLLGVPKSRVYDLGIKVRKEL